MSGHQSGSHTLITSKQVCQFCNFHIINLIKPLWDTFLWGARSVMPKQHLAMLQPSRRGRWRFFWRIFDRVKAKMLGFCLAVLSGERPPHGLKQSWKELKWFYDHMQPRYRDNHNVKIQISSRRLIIRATRQGKRHTRTHRHRHTTWAWKENFSQGQ